MVFICRKGRLENSPPFLSQVSDCSLLVLWNLGLQNLTCSSFVKLNLTLISFFQGIDLSHSVLQRIHIKYEISLVTFYLLLMICEICMLLSAKHMVCDRIEMPICVTS